MKRLQLLQTIMPKLHLLIAVLAILPLPSCSTQADNCTGHNDCFNGGTCSNNTGPFSCACPEGFTGNHCEINIDDCAGHSRCLNGGTCVDGANSYTCACAEAEFFGEHCEHQNECIYPGSCSSLNTLSRDAKCKCRKGFALDPYDSKRCEPATNKNATLIFGSKRDGGGIEQFSLSQRTVTRIQNDSTINNAIEVMYRTNTMFWSDEHGNINTAPIRQGAAKKVVLNVSQSSMLSVAVDWVYGHLYFADYKRETINVANLDGSMKKVLFDTRVTATFDIVVDPLSGWMYWADAFSQYIERAALDGSGREVIANTEPLRPSGLTLDMTQNRLYWAVHIQPASIHSMNIDGSDQKLVFKSTEPISMFHPITTFGDFVYWGESFTRAIYRTNKCGGGGATTIHSTAEYDDHWENLQVYHFSKQPEGINYCVNRIDGQCSHLCFRIPTARNESVATNCACPDGLTLSSDQRTCT